MIAAFEGLKGALALAAGMGYLSLMHRDLHQIAEALIGHIGLEPGARYPALILDSIDRLMQADRRSLLLAVVAYVAVRWAEAYGLWRDRSWGEWLGALSGALYIPFEARHFLHRPGATSALVMLANLAIVGFLAWELRGRRRPRPAQHGPSGQTP